MRRTDTRLSRHNTHASTRTKTNRVCTLTGRVLGDILCNPLASSKSFDTHADILPVAALPCGNDNSGTGYYARDNKREQEHGKRIGEAMRTLQKLLEQHGVNDDEEKRKRIAFIADTIVAIYTKVENTNANESPTRKSGRKCKPSFQACVVALIYIMAGGGIQVDAVSVVPDDAYLRHTLPERSSGGKFSEIGIVSKHVSHADSYIRASIEKMLLHTSMKNLYG